MHKGERIMGLIGLIGVIIAVVMLLTGWPFEAVMLELLAVIALANKESG